MNDGYVYFGTYSPPETRQLLKAFEQHAIRFDMAVANRMPPPSAHGRCGIDAGVAIVVHSEDVEMAIQLRLEAFKIQV